ncbi:MAG TPA: amidohydrolase family protein, partial [Acetobacteraceae bacterium]|nr:amidohydrolase family protein [Acetobacteraceae bacterium]
WILSRRGVLDLARSWALISENPAAAAGLTDRGRIAPGLRADLVVMEPDAPRIVATVASGRVTWLGAEGASRFRDELIRS